MIASSSHGELLIRSGRPIRVGFLGAGNVLPAYLQVLDRLVPRGLAEPGPVCVRRPDARAALARRRPGLPLVADVEAVLDGSDVVVVLTPPATHAGLARAALERGRHVVLEKPAGLTRAEAAPVFELARERGLQLMAAPFVQLAPTFRALWTAVADGALGHVHSGRGLYGNAGSTWAGWYHDPALGPLAEAGIYNLKSLALLAGPVVEVLAAEASAEPSRRIGDRPTPAGPDVVHVVLRHRDGALSSVVASQAVQAYRRPGLELYGTEGTANLLGDDWDPRGWELWRNALGAWELHEPLDPRWLWADGLRELVVSLREDRPPLTSWALDLHLLEVLDAARASVAAGGRAVAVRSSFEPLDLRLAVGLERQHLHDHTRPYDEQ
jgi:predicted dehydrogenase